MLNKSHTAAVTAISSFYLQPTDPQWTWNGFLQRRKESKKFIAPNSDVVAQKY